MNRLEIVSHRVVSLRTRRRSGGLGPQPLVCHGWQVGDGLIEDFVQRLALHITAELHDPPVGPLEQDWHRPGASLAEKQVPINTYDNSCQRRLTDTAVATSIQAEADTEPHIADGSHL